MLKKKMGLFLGLVALALTALPAVASAHQLTDAGGAVATPSEIFGTSTNAVTKTAVGELVCEHVEIGGSVTTNSGGAVTIGMLAESVDSATGCVRRTPLGEEAVTVTPKFEHMHLTTGGTNTAKFSYVVHFPNLGLTCNFGGTVAASVVSEGTAIQAEGAIAGTSPEPCPKGGNFSGTFSLENANGAVTID